MAAASNITPKIEDPTQPFLSFYLQNILKLTSKKLPLVEITNWDHTYWLWSSKVYWWFQTLSQEIINPKYHYWNPQDKLVSGALIGTLSSTLVPLSGIQNTPISFKELNEKLINKELSLKQNRYQNTFLLIVSTIRHTKFFQFTKTFC